MMDLYWEWRALSRTDNDIPAPSFQAAGGRQRCLGLVRSRKNLMQLNLSRTCAEAAGERGRVGVASYFRHS